MLAKALCAVWLVAALAFAQRGGYGGGEDSSRIPVGSGLPGARAEPPTRFDVFAEKLKLNKAQKAQAEGIVKDYGQQAAPLAQQMLKGRQEIAAAILDGKTGDALDRVVAGYTDSAAKLASIEATAFGEVLALLKPKQRNKAAPAFDLLIAVFEHPQMAGGRHWGGN